MFCNERRDFGLHIRFFAAGELNNAHFASFTATPRSPATYAALARRATTPSSPHVEAADTEERAGTRATRGQLPPRYGARRAAWCPPPPRREDVAGRRGVWFAAEKRQSCLFAAEEVKLDTLSHSGVTGGCASDALAGSRGHSRARLHAFPRTEQKRYRIHERPRRGPRHRVAARPVVSRRVRTLRSSSSASSGFRAAFTATRSARRRRRRSSSSCSPRLCRSSSRCRLRW